ncbi:cytochrome P450 CYP82D47-like [Silene latifolia]|uniref:cytochrome P450 CYP82D47-like n=1 Tax=Silene latifolia TaxID=37657 RepID=UPI003D7775C4
MKSMEYEYSLYAGLLIFLVSLYYFLNWNNKTGTKKTAPQPSGAWPIIGHLHLLGKLPHISLGNLADKYGPIFIIKLGVNKALVVSSSAVAKQCLGTNDRVFVDRPQTVFVQHLAYKSAMVGFSRYGPYWREMRKIMTVELLSNHRLESFKDVRMSELRSAMKCLYENGCDGRKSVEMKLWFNDISLNNIVRLIAGKSLKEFYQGDEYNKISKALRDFFELAAAFVPADALPFLRWFDIGGYEKTMKNVAKEIDRVAQDWLEMHQRKGVQEHRDFVGVLMGIFQSGHETAFDFDADVVIKAMSMAIILAATDTTSVSLTWALSLLLNNKDALKKTQAELDSIVGKQRQVEESDLKNLVYLQAVVKETLRLYPAAPLSVPRESIEDCTVDGYHIPAGTQLFVNLYKIHRDPNTWEEPCEFRPERFLTTHKDYDVRGQSFEFMPFGSGRRICPGISFALQFMQLTLASLIHGFEISTPADKSVDMTEGFGLTNLKATPLEVLLTPRLPEYLYKTC